MTFEDYCLFSALALLVCIVVVLSFDILPQKSRRQSDIERADDATIPAGVKRVPGISPAYYTGDPTNDALSIESLNLIPTASEDGFKLTLNGNITREIGINPRLHLSVYLNGRLGPMVDQKLHADSKIEINQKDTSLLDGDVPGQGKVSITYNNRMPARMVKKGFYTVRVEMYGSEEIGRPRLTGFEGGVWIEGGWGDGSRGWTHE